MCKYCRHLDNDMYISEDLATPSSNLDIEMKRDERGYIRLVGCDLDFEEMSFKSRSISFCPMCGRKLYKE